MCPPRPYIEYTRKQIHAECMCVHKHAYTQTAVSHSDSESAHLAIRLFIDRLQIDRLTPYNVEQSCQIHVTSASERAVVFLRLRIN